MRLLSSKKICILIAVLGITGTAALLGGSAVMNSRARQQFTGDGYVVTVSQNEDDQVVNLQNRFTDGTEWKKGFLSQASFRNELGEKVTVPDDSFIHYRDSSLAAMSGGSLADMDEYQNGVIGIYYLEKGNRLAENGDGFQGETDQGEKQFGNFIWKTSSRRYLIGSPSITVRLSGGNEITASGTMELYYYDKENGIVQFTDGTDAWQVVSEGCTLTLANGVSLDCESGELTRAGEDGEEQTANSAKTLNLQEITTGSSGGFFARAAVNTTGSEESSDIGEAPVFNFTLVDGEDGADGTDGESGEAGAAGSEGGSGGNGQNGSRGEDGANGAAGVSGADGGVGVSGTSGGVDPGVSVKTGTPEVITPTWEQKGTGLNFTLQYEEQSYDAIDPTTEKAYVYIYDLATGEIVWERKAQTITADESEIYVVDPSVLKMDTTYCLTVVDTYSLAGISYTTRVLERIFTTDDSGLQVTLTRPGKESVGLGIFCGDQKYTTLKTVEVTLTAEDGTTVGPFTFNEEDGVDFSDLNLDGLTHNTNYRANLKVTYEITDKGDTGKKTTQEKELSYTFTTLKEQPGIGGLSLRAEEGSLVADVLGLYNTDDSIYNAVSDPDGALISVTYSLYDQTEISRANGRTPIMTQTADKNGSAYFKVDGELIRNGQTYFVLAEYTMNDGSGEVTLPVEESNPAGTSYDTVTSQDLGRAFAACKAVRSSGISLSFSGNGTNIYNTQNDQSEGTTYASITGSLMVNLGESAISVSDARKLTLTITDRRTYEKKQSWSSVAGKQGDMKGSFALPIDMDGLLMNNTYIFTLNAYLYDKNSETYRQTDIGTIAVRTDESASVKMGMQTADNGGVGVDFWLGAQNFGDARELKNYYDAKLGCYIDENDDPEESKETYFANTDAAYRNLSSIVFELYSGSSLNPSETDLVGICEIAAEDDDGDRIQTRPGESELYRQYYGSAAATSTTNNVGVGESFTHQFQYAPNTKKTGIIPESALTELLPSAVCTIRVRYIYDYTYDRRFLFNSSYDYFLPTPSLNEDDYINHLLINDGEGCLLSDIRFQRRPVSPADMVDKKTGYAMTAQTVMNRDMKSLSRNADATLYDEALDAQTAVGLDVTSAFSDSYKITKTMTVYGTTYTPYTEQWTDASQSLDITKDEQYTDENGQNAYIFPFKFTMNMTLDGTETGSRRDSMPKLRLLMYDSASYDWDAALEADGYSRTKGGDRGYQWYKFDNSADMYILYTDVSFLKRGSTYIFGYDAVMDFEEGDNNGVFEYPAHYYRNGWVSGKIYNKTTMLQSAPCSIEKQVPQMDLYLKETERTGETDKEKKTDRWQMSLYDPDSALDPEFLLGYSKDTNQISGLYNLSTGAALDQYGDFIQIKWKDLILLYGPDDVTGQMTAEVRRDNQQLDREAAIAAMDEMLTAMRMVEGETLEQAGTEVQFANIRDTSNISYSWRGVYRTVTDYLPKRHDGMIPLAEHQIYGYYEMQEPAASTLYTLKSEVDEETHDKVTVTFEPKGDDFTNEYYSEVNRISAIRIRAKDKTGNYLTTTLPSGKTVTMEAWASTAGGSPRYFTYLISAFDKTGADGNRQVTLGENLEFEYEFYYYGGDYSTAADDDSYYRLKRVNGTEVRGIINGKVTTTSDNSLVRKPQDNVTVTTVKANDGTTWVKSMTNSITAVGYGMEEDQLSAEENLRYGQDESSDYAMGVVAEFCRLDRVTASWEYSVLSMAPTLASSWTSKGLTEVQAGGTLRNYQLLNYPKTGTGDEREPLHLYYAVYEETKTADETTLTLKGVVIGDSSTILDKEGKCAVRFTGLDQGKNYRIYIYYKDNRSDDAKTDQELFGTVPEAGTCVTGNAAEKLAKVFTPLKEGKLNPESNTVTDSKITKLPGLPSHLVTEADQDVGIEAVYDNYIEINTLDGIPVNNLRMVLDTGAAYINNGASSKSLTIGSGSVSVQDEQTKVYLALERCPAGSEGTEDEWKTVIANEGYDNAEEKALLQQAGIWRDWANINRSLTRNANLKYFENYPQCKVSGLSSSDITTSATITPSISMPVYPEGVFQPGYSYRVKEVIFQYDADGKNPLLVSLDGKGSDNRYGLSDTVTWSLYSYNELNRPVTLTNIVQEVTDDSASENTISMNMSIRQLNYLDNKIYVRICEKQNGIWQVLDDDQYYDTIGSTKINQMAFAPSSSYQLKFRNLKKGTTYRLQFYALVDRDYDNQVDIVKNGVPLGTNDTADAHKIYTDLDAYYADKTLTTPPANNLDALYRYYYKTTGASAVPAYLGGTDNTNAQQIILDWSSEITTFKEGQLGTIGNHYQSDVDSTGTELTLHFADASGLGKVASCQYYIKYVPNLDDTDNEGADVTGTIVADTVSGLITNAASGNVELVIRNGQLQLKNPGTYYIQLQLMTSDNREFEKPDTIKMIVD